MDFRRNNGLSAPYSGAQISAWIAFGATIVQFGVIVAPLLPKCAIAPIVIVFVVIAFAAAYYGGHTQIIDPVDVHLRAASPELTVTTKLDQLYCHVNAPRQLPVIDEPLKQCWICDTQVAEHSMHCKFCNKCVYHFDHHCMWLNTCIGKNNYRYFFRTMLSLFVLEMYHFAIQLFLIIDLFLDGPTQRRAYFHSSAMAAILIFFALFNVLSLFSIGQLILFHFNLQRKRLSTYQYIVEDHKRKRTLMRRLGDLENQRIVKITQLEQSNQTVTACVLKCGGVFRSMGCSLLDPLDLPPPPEEPDLNGNFANSLGNQQELAQYHSTSNSNNKDTNDDCEEEEGESALSRALDDASAHSKKQQRQQQQQQQQYVSSDIHSTTTSQSRDGGTSRPQPPQQHAESHQDDVSSVDVVEQFENEPDDRSVTSGCSSKHQRSGERDYTNF